METSVVYLRNERDLLKYGNYAQSFAGNSLCFRHSASAINNLTLKFFFSMPQFGERINIIDGPSDHEGAIVCRGVLHHGIPLLE